MAAATSADATTVTGRILNKGTGDYLKYAQVQVVGTEQTTISEEGGYYTLANVAPGEVKIRVSYTGLDAQEVSVTVPADGTVTADVTLSSAEYGELVTLGEFKVSSAREGNAKAIIEQRQALNMKTVVASDSFGDVSEGNVGEFLRLLPGVTVDYVDNDVRTARIRGLPPKYTTFTMDGRMIATAGSASINTGRQFELEQVSLNSLDTIESAKSPTPDMLTPGLAGNSNVISKSAFNQKGRTIKYNANLMMNQYDFTFSKTDGWDDKDHRKLFPSGNVEWIDTLMDGRLGIVVSVGHSSTYNEQRAVTSSETFDRNPDNNDTETPLVSQIQFQDGPKISNRDSLLLNLEYKVTDDLRLGVRTSYGYYRAEFYNRNWQINASTTNQVSNTSTTNGAWSGAGGEFVSSFIRTGVSFGTDWGNYISTATTNSTTALANTQTNAFITGSNMRKSGGTFVISPNATWKVGDFKVDAAASYSRAVCAYRSGRDGYFSYIQTYMPNISWGYTKTGDRGYQITQTNAGTYANTGSILDVANYNTNGLALDETRDGKDQIWSGNADVEWDRSDWSLPTTFKAGASTSLKVLDIQTLQARWTLNLNPATGGVNLADYADPFTSDIGGGTKITDLNGRVGTMPNIDKWKLYELFAAGGNIDPYSSTANGAFTAQSAANLRYRFQNQWDIKEKIHTGYVMATVKPTKKLSLVGGLRFETTDTTGRRYDDKGGTPTLLAMGYYLNTTESAPLDQAAYNTTGRNIYWLLFRASGTGTTSNATGRTYLNSATNTVDYITYRYGQRRSHSQDYSNVLPSLQARYNISKDFVARAAYYKSLMRPDLQYVVGGVTVTDNTDNPTRYQFNINGTGLKPETADNFDASLEYYLNPVGVVSVAGFYKDITDIQVSTTETIDLNNIPEELAAIGVTSTNIDPASTIGRIRNGPKTSIWGTELAYNQELSFLPGVWKGLGVTANYTYISPEDKRIWALVANAGDGLSKQSANFIVRYKLNRFNGQISASWADLKINGISGLSMTPTGDLVTGTGLNSNVYTYIRDRWVVNMSLNYKVNRYATVFFNVNNMLNSEQYRYVEREVFTNRHGIYGAFFYLGVKGQL